MRRGERAATALVVAACVMLLAGCAARVLTAKVPGCAMPAEVLVPEGCYSTIFNGALEVRCDDRTIRYSCTAKKVTSD